jgi:F0F1-type ATP synthase membrane subunit b/b'
VADHASAIAERLIKKSLNDADHRRVVDDAIARMGQKN